MYTSQFALMQRSWEDSKWAEEEARWEYSEKLAHLEEEQYLKIIEDDDPFELLFDWSESHSKSHLTIWFDAVEPRENLHNIISTDINHSLNEWFREAMINGNQQAMEYLGACFESAARWRAHERIKKQAN